MTNEQKRTRNWQKARLSGFGMNDLVMTEEERELFQQMMRLKFQLLDNWDRNTEILIGHALSPYKCEHCRKRSNKEWSFLGRNFCYKHYSIYINEIRDDREIQI